MEKRKQKERTRINLAIFASNPPISQSATVTNISTTGAFISSLQTLPVDSQIAIDMQLPGDSATMTINALVVWTEPATFATPGGMGIEFTDILPEHQEKLTVFIEQNSHSDSRQKQAMA